MSGFDAPRRVLAMVWFNLSRLGMKTQPPHITRVLRERAAFFSSLFVVIIAILAGRSNPSLGPAVTWFGLRAAAAVTPFLTA